MPELFDHMPPVATLLKGKSVEELLLLVADDDQGLKTDAMERLLSMGFKTLYPALERGVRNDDNADLRNSSMEMLVAFAKDAIPALIKLLKDDNEEVRNFAAVMLGDIGNRSAVGALIRALGDQDPNVSHSAAEALGKIGDRSALFPLIDLLKEDFWVQYPAIAAIGAMRDYRAVPHLLEFLDNDLLAGPAVDALAEIADPRALYPLGRILPGVDDGLAGQVAKAMLTTYRAVTEALSFKNSLAEYYQPEHLKAVINADGALKLRRLLVPGSDKAVLEAAVMLLGWLEDSGAVELFYPLLTDEALIAPVETAIFSIGESVSASLIASLDDDNDNVRIVALRSLRNFGVMEHSDRLMELLASKNETLLFEVLDTVKEIPAEKFLPQLLDLLLSGSSQACGKAAEALGRYPLASLKTFLLSISRSSDSAIRKRGALLLCHLQDDDFSTLAPFVHDTDAEVRTIAIKAAGIQKASIAMPQLGAALHDPDIAVREAAVMAIAEFRTPIMVEEILSLLAGSNEPLDYAVVKALGMMAATSAETALIDYLQSGNASRRVEYALLETFGKIGAKSASALIRNRYLSSPDPDVRRLAVETLGLLGDRNSIEAVEAALSDGHWSVRVAAVHVLANLGGIGEIPLLLAAMKDADPMVRKHAIQALGDIRNISTLPALIHELTDMEMSRHAFLALLKCGKPALPWLHRHMMKNYPVDVRVRLIDLIGKIGDRKSVDPLMELLDDHNPTIRLAAIDSLTFCFDGLLLKKLTNIKGNDSDPEVQNRATLALKTFTMEKFN
jgi:HEAT repeat protein